jgi:hypothetical protein
VNCWDQFEFDAVACQWINIGIPVDSVEITDTILACGSYTWNGTLYTADAIVNADTVNCIIQQILIDITPLNNSATMQTACGSFAWNGQSYTASGTYTFDNGCGTDTLYLTITPISNSATTQTACGSYSWNGQTYSASGTYTFDNGCGTDTLYLSITPISNSATTQTACGSYSWNGQSYSTSGTYTFDNGCGTDTLYLTIAPPPSVVITGQASICNGETSDLTATVNPPGSYTYTWLQNGNAIVGQTDSLLLASDSADYKVIISNGVCEASSSVFTLSILPTPVVSLYLSGAAAGDSADITQPTYLVAVSSDTSLSYTWYLNGTDLGVQNDSLMAEESGIYVVTVTNGTCSSSDFVVITGSRSSVANSRIRLQAYPNPSRGLYELSVDNLRGTARIEVMDALGKLVHEGEMSSQGIKTRQELDIRHVAMGIYTLRLQTIDGPKFIRLKKE